MPWDDLFDTSRYRKSKMGMEITTYDIVEEGEMEEIERRMEEFEERLKRVEMAIKRIDVEERVIQEIENIPIEDLMSRKIKVRKDKEGYVGYL